MPGLFKDELGGKIKIKAVAIRPKTYAYLTDDGNNHKKAKGTKKCVIKQKRKFKNYKDYLFMVKLYTNHNKDLKAIIMTYIQKKLVRLH